MTQRQMPGQKFRPFRSAPRLSVVAALAVVCVTLAVTAETRATPPMARADDAPVVVELFTSQGCYSCPPAEAMLSELATRDGVVALEHHVDYWDDLVYGAAGRWKDVFSTPEATERQRVYASVVPGRGHSYTPQMVIDGRYEAVGSRESEVNRAINKARKPDTARLGVSAMAAGDDGLSVRVTGDAAEAGAGIWLVRFLREHTTEIRAGENKGKTLVGRNVVLEMTRIGEWDGSDTAIDLASRPDAEHGCAIIVQPDGQGPVLGAAYCDLGKMPAS